MKIGLSKSWDDINIISSITSCCDNLADRLIGEKKFRDIIISKSQHCIEDLRSNELSFCQECGDKISFFNEMKQYDTSSRKFILKIDDYDHLIIKLCCIAFATILHKSIIHFGEYKFRFSNYYDIKFCPFCKKKLPSL